MQISQIMSDQFAYIGQGASLERAAVRSQPPEATAEPTP